MPYGSVIKFFEWIHVRAHKIELSLENRRFRMDIYLHFNNYLT